MPPAGAVTTSAGRLAICCKAPGILGVALTIRWTPGVPLTMRCTGGPGVVAMDMGTELCRTTSGATPGVALTMRCTGGPGVAAMDMGTELCRTTSGAMGTELCRTTAVAKLG